MFVFLRFRLNNQRVFTLAVLVLFASSASLALCDNATETERNAEYSLTVWLPTKGTHKPALIKNTTRLNQTLFRGRVSVGYLLPAFTFAVAMPAIVFLVLRCWGMIQHELAAGLRTRSLASKENPGDAEGPCSSSNTDANGTKQTGVPESSSSRGPSHLVDRRDVPPDGDCGHHSQGQPVSLDSYRRSRSYSLGRRESSWGPRLFGTYAVSHQRAGHVPFPSIRRSDGPPRESRASQQCLYSGRSSVPAVSEYRGEQRPFGSSEESMITRLSGLFSTRLSIVSGESAAKRGVRGNRFGGSQPHLHHKVETKQETSKAPSAPSAGTVSGSGGGVEDSESSVGRIYHPTLHAPDHTTLASHISRCPSTRVSRNQSILPSFPSVPGFNIGGVKSFGGVASHGEAFSSYSVHPEAPLDSGELAVPGGAVGGVDVCGSTDTLDSGGGVGGGGDGRLGRGGSMHSREVISKGELEGVPGPHGTSLSFSTKVESAQIVEVMMHPNKQLSVLTIPKCEENGLRQSDLEDIGKAQSILKVAIEQFHQSWIKLKKVRNDLSSLSDSASLAALLEAQKAEVPQYLTQAKKYYLNVKKQLSVAELTYREKRQVLNKMQWVSRQEARALLLCVKAKMAGRKLTRTQTVALAAAEKVLSTKPGRTPGSTVATPEKEKGIREIVHEVESSMQNLCGQLKTLKKVNPDEFGNLIRKAESTLGSSQAITFQLQRVTLSSEQSNLLKGFRKSGVEPEGRDRKRQSPKLGEKPDCIS